MNTIRTSAPGKLILMGEHAVVYGKPAIIGAIDKRCFVAISPRKDKKIKIVSENFGTEIVTDIDEIIAKFNKAQVDWNKFYQNNDVEILKSITIGSLDYPQIIIGQFIDYFKGSLVGITPHPNPLLRGEGMKGVSGFDMEINSEIPVGAGMGSSAALAVSIIGALYYMINKRVDKDIAGEIAFRCEKIIHGHPSGGDKSASTFGGLIWFQKNNGVRSLNIKLPEKIIKNFYFINTGTPDELTGEMVALVKNRYQNNPEETDTILNAQEYLTEKFLEALEKEGEEEIIKCIIKAEENLEKLGVVSPSAMSLIKNIEKSGGAAKISGAGGRKDKSGVILVYHNNLQDLENVLKSCDIEAEHLKLDQSGLRVE